MKIAIYGRAFNEKYAATIQQLFDKLSDAGVKLFIYEPFNFYLFSRIKTGSNISTFKRQDEICSKVDFLLSIGGDGTLLDTITFVKNSGLPILGINTGRLGFLSSVPTDAIEEAITALLKGNYSLDKRTLLRLETENNLFGDINYALNELTIHKKDSSSMMTIHAYINGEYLNSYWADGLIVSTPTGSTAYSLSCGGPIILPGSENFIITPIAPHNLNVRPVVISDKSTITLKIEDRSSNYMATLDSRTETIDTTVELTIKKESFRINLIRLNNQNFLATLRNKLMWGMDLRN